MKKIIRLTESDLTRIVKQVMNESSRFPHPVETDMWNEMIGNVEGDLVDTIEYIPNQKLVINAFGNIYTITLKKGTPPSNNPKNVPNTQLTKKPASMGNQTARSTGINQLKPNK